MGLEPGKGKGQGHSTDGEMLAHQLALAEWQMMRVRGVPGGRGLYRCV